MSTLDKEITEVIEKNLPAHVGTALQKRLAQAETDAAELQRVNDQRTDLLNQVAQLKLELSDKSNLLHKHDELDKREAAVKEAERDAKVLKAELELAAEKRISSAMQDTLKLLVRNTSFRQEVWGTKPVPVEGMAPGAGGYGGTPGSVQSHPYSQSETYVQD